MIDEILRLPDVVKITKLSPSTLWRMERSGDFPKRVKIGIRATGWKMSEVQVWISAHSAAVPAPVSQAPAGPSTPGT